ncbi:glycosyltransferase [Pontibacter sp. SGAir0037]|uniref:glycosyltransferase n=1 Tax=Pontibacter sp. SGAir0037 TaxID=2571030 RepID=UPI0010CD08FA|nr:glycosyltransferase [Pontibacter sp. SGAir0037]QCR22498.1 glycosyl transferase family 1 [Pontibacter sp. SGAir0037]
MNKYKITGKDIVIVGQQPWDTEIGSNCKDIALEFSKDNRVLYVNAPLDRNTVLKHRDDPKIQDRLRVVKGKEQGLKAVSSNLWVLNPDKIMESINWMPHSPLYNYFNKINNKRFAGAIEKSIRSLGFRNFILFNDNDIFRSFYLKDLLLPEISVYYSRDYMLATDYWRKHGAALEPQLIAKSDLCVANSGYLASYCGRYNTNAYYVGQGCDLSSFQQAEQLEMPADMLALNKPIIGYVGALVSLRLDIEVLEYMAAQRPEWNIVLVGPEDEAFKNSALHQMANVHFLGLKTPQQLPAYIQNFNVCLNPQRVNEMTIGNYPRKLDEYLALGKPVVATKTEAMEVFKEHVYLAESKEAYVQLVELGLEDDSKRLQKLRQEFAATHTWENSVSEIYKAIYTYSSQKEEKIHAMNS